MLIFSRDLEIQHWASIESFYIFGTGGFYFVRKWCILCEICIAIFNFKALFHKIEYLVEFQHFIS